MIVNTLAAGRCYVGSSVNVFRRFDSHLKMLTNKKHHSYSLQNAWNKYGEDAFRFIILECLHSKEMLLEREQHWIDVLKAYGHGYNRVPKAASTIGYKHTDDARQRMSKAKKGKPSPKRGVPVSEAQREFLRTLRLGKKMSPEAIAKSADGHRGLKRTAETRKKMSASLKKAYSNPELKRQVSERTRELHRQGRLKGPKGCVRSQETREKIAASLRGRKTGPRSDAIREKLRLAAIARYQRPEERLKTSQAAVLAHRKRKL